MAEGAAHANQSCRLTVGEYIEALQAMGDMTNKMAQEPLRHIIDQYSFETVLGIMAEIAESMADKPDEDWSLKDINRYRSLSKVLYQASEQAGRLEL